MNRDNNQLYDLPLTDIVDYFFSTQEFPHAVVEQAQYALMDAMSCVLLSLQDKHCIKHLKPIIPYNNQINGARVPGTQLQLDPIQSAYHISCMIRWLDYNDTWLAKEWGHPSDNLGALLACADYYSRQPGNPAWSLQDILNTLIKTYEIQGILALENSFNEFGFDHVILVRIASTAAAVYMLGGDRQQMLSAISNAFLDGAALRTYRHDSNTGPRKSWAAADASSRGVKLALLALNGESGYPTALTAEKWGFNAVLLRNKSLIRNRPYAHYVIDNILYKITYPVEFHAQTAVECALALTPIFKQNYHSKVSQIHSIEIFTQQAAMDIINKTGLLTNPADRDHCMQYAVAVSLLQDSLLSKHYHDSFANSPDNKHKIDNLREKITLIEDPQYTLDYYHPDKRAIANRIKITFSDGKSFSKEVIYPLGHKLRRDQAIPLLKTKFENAVKMHFTELKTKSLLQHYFNLNKFLNLSITDWMALMQCDVNSG